MSSSLCCLYCCISKWLTLLLPCCAGNVFSGILNNSLFCGILFTTAVLQVLIVEFGSVAFAVKEGGLEAKYWGLSLLIGFGSLPVQQVINVLYMLVMGNGSGAQNSASGS